MAQYRVSFTLWLFLGCFLVIGTFLFAYQFIGQKNAVCANSITCISDLNGSFRSGQTNVFMGKAVESPVYLAESTLTPKVLGETTEQKHIYVDLAKQQLMAVEGDREVLSFPVSTGKWGRTPTGEFRIWIKLRYAHMSGGSVADGTYYNLYNIPYTMFFEGANAAAGQGYSLHGAYWHNNFGWPMSHGCVNIRPEDAGKLYNWVGPVTQGDTTHATADNPGTVVTIFGQPPG